MSNETVSMILDEAKEKMQASLDAFEEDLRGMRSGRASTALVEKMMVDYYGQPTEMRQLANISTPEAMQILIRPYDGGALKDIERAIQQSDLGINPNNDGSAIRLNMPALTRETRQKLVKFLNDRTEDARISVRNSRRDANKDLKDFEKEGDIGEDDMKRGEDAVQKLTNETIAKIDAASKAKETEIMEV
ncbi:MAG: ribosome recycling factor [Chloroflexota bacterium]